MINGQLLRKAFINASHSIQNNKKQVDELNVFPVPDGDTGTNMSMTLSNAVSSLNNLDENCSASEVAETTASCLLRGARGNSGVILSLIFRGFAKAFAGKDEIGAKDLASALTIGTKEAYKSVMKPTEGTILTVARESAEKAVEISHSTNDCSVVMDEVVKQAELSLEQTPSLLPALAKAGVVDAGGKGLVIVFTAINDILKGGEIVPLEQKNSDSVTVESFSSAVGKYDSEINFTYCTEMIITKKKDAEDSSKLRAYLETIGDCVVVVEDDEIIKVHTHTNNPGKAIEKGLEFGYINLPKIENMKLQHKEKQKQAENDFVAVKPEKEYGFVAVCSGDGVENMFRDAGVDCIVKGGQTMNPSTDDLLKAIESVPAENVFVLPNNKNIIMAAEQAVSLADRKVCVLQTRTIPQGMCAVMYFDPSADFNTNRSEMTKAFEKVSTGQITYADRDADYEGHSIKQGEILCMSNGKLSFVERELSKASYKLCKKLIKSKSDCCFVTIIYGADVQEEDAEELYKHLSEKFPSIEFNLINGGQPVYYYIFSVE